MVQYFVKRLLLILPKLLVISIIVFVAIQLTPGDPMSFLINPETMRSGGPELEQAKEALGLNDPLHMQYLRWMGNMLKGDLGYSLRSGASISQQLALRMPATLELALGALLVSSLFGLLFGVLSAAKQNSILDRTLTVFGVLGISVPDFFLALCGIQLFAIQLGWLPVGGRMAYGQDTFLSRLPNLIMPCLFLGISLIAVLMRYTRSSIVETLSQDYIKTARLKGIPEWKVHIRHALRNALNPVILILAFRLPLLIGGTVVLETVFNWPGMGSFLVSSIQSSDYPVIMIVVLMISAVTLIASFIVDLCTALLDPRVRTE